MTNGIQKNNPKIVNAWCMYDWANSVYSLTITTAIFPIYWSGVVKGENGSPFINFLGVSIKSEDLYSFTLSSAFVMIALINPLLSGIADVSGKKKMFMKFFAWMGAASCFSLYWFDSNTLWLGILAFMFATVGFAGSLVFYNAYLPEIATEDQFDRVSARGFSMGYIGSVLLLVLNLVMIQKGDWFGWKEVDGVRYSFWAVGIWWFAFSAYTFLILPKENKFNFEKGMLSKGYQEVKKVWSQLQELPNLKRYLLAFFFYSMSFQTIMYLASIFGTQELHMATGDLIGIVLIIQLVAIAGAYLFSLGSKRFGNIHTIIIAVCFCILICVGAYFTTTSGQFFMLAFLVGIIMGGIQSLSRSTYAKLLPESEDHASFFSFYELTDKVGTAVGTGMFGILNVLTGSMRNSIMVLVLFFCIGIWQLSKIRKVK